MSSPNVLDVDDLLNYTSMSCIEGVTNKLKIDPTATEQCIYASDGLADISANAWCDYFTFDWSIKLQYMLEYCTRIPSV
jgi:hypothetical protein